MHRTKKLTVTAMAAALLMAGGVSTAMADHQPGHENGNEKVTICHRTGSDKNPYRKITISQKAWSAHQAHPPIDGRRDVYPDAQGNCPSGPTTPPPGGGGDDNHECIASSGSGDSTQTQHGLVNVGNVNLGLNSGDSHQEQRGLVNVGNVNLGADNLLGNAFCQSNVLNNLAVAVIGDAVGGVVEGSGDGDCIAESLSGDSVQDQDGAVNVGNLNVSADDALGNLFCQADVLNNPAISLIGSALGGSTLGSELLSGPTGILSGAPDFLLSGLTADVRVLANVLVLF